MYRVVYVLKIKGIRSQLSRSGGGHPRYLPEAFFFYPYLLQFASSLRESSFRVLNMVLGTSVRDGEEKNHGGNLQVE